MNKYKFKPTKANLNHVQFPNSMAANAFWV